MLELAGLICSICNSAAWPRSGRTWTLRIWDNRTNATTEDHGHTPEIEILPTGSTQSSASAQTPGEALGQGSLNKVARRRLDGRSLLEMVLNETSRSTRWE